MHSDEAGGADYPPPTGWPNITYETYASTGRTKAVIDLIRHLPQFTDPPCILPDTIPSRYMNEPAEFNLAANLESEQQLDASTDEGGSRLPSHIFQLAESGNRYGFNLFIDTNYGAVYWYSQDGSSLNEFPLGDAKCYDESKEVDDTSPDMWMVNSAYKIDTFFAICKEKFIKLHWIPITESGQGEVDEAGENPSEEADERIQIMKRAGWPGDGEGGGWDKEKAQEELENWIETRGY